MLAIVTNLFCDSNSRLLKSNIQSMVNNLNEIRDIQNIFGLVYGAVYSIVLFVVSVFAIRQQSKEDDKPNTNLSDDGTDVNSAVEKTKSTHGCLFQFLKIRICGLVDLKIRVEKRQSANAKIYYEIPCFSWFFTHFKGKLTCGIPPPAECVRIGYVNIPP